MLATPANGTGNEYIISKGLFFCFGIDSPERFTGLPGCNT